MITKQTLIKERDNLSFRVSELEDKFKVADHKINAMMNKLIDIQIKNKENQTKLVTE